MSTVKNRKKPLQDASTDEHKLSMRAAREARNGLTATLANLQATTDGLTELDDILLEVIRPRVEEGLKFLIILTKADKLTRAEQAKALSIARLQAGGGEVKLFSALKKQGVDEVAQLLWDWTHPAGGAAVPAPSTEPPEEEPEALDE